VRRFSALPLALILWSRGAGAAHVQVNLQYEREVGAAACSPADELRAAVATRLGYDPFVAQSGLDTISVRLRPHGTGFEGTIEQLDPAGHARGAPTRIAGRNRDCTELSATLAVAIAIAIDPLSLTRPFPASQVSPTPPSPSPPAPPQPPLHVEDVPTERHPVPFEFQAGVGPSIAIGALPLPSVGVRALAAFVRGSARVEVEGRFDPPVTVRAAGGSVEASLVLGSVVPCLSFGLFIGCARASFGVLRGAGLDFDHTYDASTLYVTIGGQAGVQLPLGPRLAVRLMGDGDVPVIPTRLDAGGSVVWTTPPFAVSAVLLLIGRFP
jgi:hypothetical protein